MSEHLVEPGLPDAALQEATHAAEQTEVLEDILRWRPPLPVGAIDLSQYRLALPSSEPTEPGYAWERLPRWLTTIDDTFKKASDVPVVHLDLCSSVPLYAQMMRALEFKRSSERARELVAAMYSDTAPQQFPMAHELVEVHTAASDNSIRNKTPLRRLLVSAVQRVLYTRNSGDMAQGDTEESHQLFADRLAAEIANQQVIYDCDVSGDDSESKWQLKFYEESQDANLLDMFSRLAIRTPDAWAAGLRMKHYGVNDEDRALAAERQPAGENLARDYIQWLANGLAAGIAGNERYRPARFISLDQSQPIDIASSSLQVTPESTRHMNMYSHALASLFDPNMHLVGDIFEPLPMPDNSVTLITCMDAWPFYSNFDGLSGEEIDGAIYKATEIIGNWYDKLAYNGKMVIFPWSVEGGNPRDAAILRQTAAQLSLRFGHAVQPHLFHRGTLMEFLSEADRTTATELSPIFKGDVDDIYALIIEKPAKALVKQHAKSLGRRMLYASSNSGLAKSQAVIMPSGFSLSLPF